MQRNLIYEIKNKILVVAFKGELNFATFHEFECFVGDNYSSFDTMILDFTDLDYVNSTTIGAIYNRAREKKALIVSSKNGAVRRVFDMLGVSNVIPVFESIEDAFAELGKQGV
jgi:anti-anti-sigma factor